MTAHEWDDIKDLSLVPGIVQIESNVLHEMVCDYEILMGAFNMTSSPASERQEILRRVRERYER